MIRLRQIFHILLFAMTLPAAAEARDINVGSIFDAVKGVNRSREVGNMSERQEIAIGKEIAEDTFARYRIIKDEALQRYLNRVGLWVALQSKRPNLPWHFAAVRAEQVNAFAIPGGTVLITSGMLQLLSNEAELACVLGHEIGHIVRKHHIHLLEKELLLQSGTKVVADNLQGSGKNREAKKFLVGEGSELYTRSLDRDSERDADHDGVLLAARAGYDPGACLLFMQRMASLKAEASLLAALYKTHPQAGERVKDVERALGLIEGMDYKSSVRPLLDYRKSGDH